MEIRLTAEVGIILRTGKRAAKKESIANKINCRFVSFHIIIPMTVKPDKAAKVDHMGKEL